MLSHSRAFALVAGLVAGSLAYAVDQWLPADEPPGLVCLSGQSGGLAAVTWTPTNGNPQVVVGGEFVAAGGHYASNIAAWDGVHWTSLGTGTNEGVQCLAVYNGQVIAGGDFTVAGGVACSHIAAWDGAQWRPLGDGIDGSVRALCVHDGELIAGGSFSFAGGVAAANVAAWNGSAWRPLPGVNGAVTALGIYQDELIAAGYSGVMRWDGAAWHALATDCGPVEALAEYQGALYIGGMFSQVDGVPASNMARWDGFAWTGLPDEFVSAETEVRVLTTYGDRLIVGGTFYWVGDVIIKDVAAWDGAQWSGLGAGVTSLGSGDVAALAELDGALLVFGEFSEVDSVLCRNAARWDGTAWLPVGAGLNASVTALAEVDGELFVAGLFNSAGGKPLSQIARLTANGWDALGGKLEPDFFFPYFSRQQVNAIASTTVGLIIVGDFGSIDGHTCRGVARWDGAAWQPMGTAWLHQPYAIVEYEDHVIVGGTFSTSEPKYVARWDGATWQPWGGNVTGQVYAFSTQWGPLVAGAQTGVFVRQGSSWTRLGATFDREVRALAAYRGVLYAGGDFTAIGATACNHIARWDGAQWQPVGEGLIAPVRSLAATGGYLYAGSGALVQAGEPRPIARWDGANWHDLPGSVTILERCPVTSCAQVPALCVLDRQLVIGGSFQRAGDQPAACLARWGDPAAPTACAGDVNCSGMVDFGDIDKFVSALSGPAAWEADPANANCPWLAADCSGDNDVTFADIDPFVARLGTSCR